MRYAYPPYHSSIQPVETHGLSAKVLIGSRVISRKGFGASSYPRKRYPFFRGFGALIIVPAKTFDLVGHRGCSASADAAPSSTLGSAKQPKGETMNEASTLFDCSRIIGSVATARVGAMRPLLAPGAGRTAHDGQGGVACRALAATGGAPLEWRAARSGWVPARAVGGEVPAALAALSRPRRGQVAAAASVCTSLSSRCWLARGARGVPVFGAEAGCRRSVGASYGTQQTDQWALESAVVAVAEKQRRPWPRGCLTAKSWCAKTKPFILRCVGWALERCRTSFCWSITPGSHGGAWTQALTRPWKGWPVEVIQDRSDEGKGLSALCKARSCAFHSPV